MLIRSSATRMLQRAATGRLYAAPRTVCRSTVLNTAMATRILPSSSMLVGSDIASSMFSTRTEPSSPVLQQQQGMFCRQCEQTSNNFACTSVGVCGKSAETSSTQDALLYVVQSVSRWVVAAQNADRNGSAKALLDEINVWTLQSLFSTMTNVNFSSDRINEYTKKGIEYESKLEDLVVTQLGGTPPAPVTVNPETGNNILQDFLKSSNDFEAFGHLVSVPARQQQTHHEDGFALTELAMYGIKGACAYAAHCHALLEAMSPEDKAANLPAFESITADVQAVLAKLGTLEGGTANDGPSDDPKVNAAFALVMQVGEINGRVLALLDQAHATKFGAPEPTQVRMTAVQGKCILISGHDMEDLHALLQQTQGLGINVYTHGEMLPAHGYPKLKKEFPHLVGNFGTAWQNQKFEFASFPGPVIVTTNCIVEPRRTYRQRLYTMNQVGYDGVQHIGEDRDFKPVIEQALGMDGFPRTIEPASFHTVGFNHRAVLPIADQVLGAAQSGALSRIVLIGGCDGSQWERSYFTDVAENLPDDTLILTLGCAKNRFIQSEKLEGATLANGLPRVIDMGQCNDAYSAVVVASELAKALECSINELPLSICLSHLEQKAAAVLLTLLSLGVKNIRLGPSLPAYITPNVLNMLVEHYNVMPTGDVNKDIESMMKGE
mmetsp:Transcript_16822/g.47165  ORF Transcript_16822/g.47165 Transcript_16822/m.47165 type:complete len:664 (+) Transcript_16822:127-2118(+)